MIHGTAAGITEDGMIHGIAADGIILSTTITDGTTRTTATEQDSLRHLQEAAKTDIMDSERTLQHLR